MGSFNATCGFSGLIIGYCNADSVIIPVRSGILDQRGCYNTDTWYPSGTPVMGVYDDYGQFEIEPTETNELSLRLATAHMKPSTVRHECDGEASVDKDTITWLQFLVNDNDLKHQSGHRSYYAITRSIYDDLSAGYLPSGYYGYDERPALFDARKNAEEVVDKISIALKEYGYEKDDPSDDSFTYEVFLKKFGSAFSDMSEEQKKALYTVLSDARSSSVDYFGFKDFWDWTKSVGLKTPLNGLVFGCGRSDDSFVQNKVMDYIFTKLAAGEDVTDYIESLIRFSIFHSNMSELNKFYTPSIYGSQEMNYDAVQVANRMVQRAVDEACRKYHED